MTDLAQASAIGLSVLSFFVLKAYLEVRKVLKLYR